MEINLKLREMIDHHDPDKLEALVAGYLGDDYPRDDLSVKAAIRYLVHKKLWGTGSIYDSVLDKFFGAQAEHKMVPETYRRETGQIIKAMFDYDMPEYVAPTPLTPASASRPKRKKKVEQKEPNIEKKDTPA